VRPSKTKDLVAIDGPVCCVAAALEKLAPAENAEVNFMVTSSKCAVRVKDWLLRVLKQ